MDTADGFLGARQRRSLRGRVNLTEALEEHEKSVLVVGRAAGELRPEKWQARRDLEVETRDKSSNRISWMLSLGAAAMLTLGLWVTAAWWNFTERRRLLEENGALLAELESVERTLKAAAERERDLEADLGRWKRRAEEWETRAAEAEREAARLAQERDELAGRLERERLRLKEALAERDRQREQGRALQEELRGSETAAQSALESVLDLAARLEALSREGAAWQEERELLKREMR